MALARRPPNRTTVVYPTQLVLRDASMAPRSDTTDNYFRIGRTHTKGNSVLRHPALHHGNGDHSRAVFGLATIDPIVNAAEDFPGPPL